MAGVFLSYAREDIAKAKALARLLEKAGHKVWWDRQIHGGSEFSSEIEAALKQADVVIVLWSESSIVSEWVRDEASEGRDTGRLLPIALDSSRAPLGFRQRQSIDLSDWSGSRSPRNFESLLDALSAKSGSNAAFASKATPDAAPGFSLRRALPVALLAALAIVLSVGTWLYLAGRPGSATTPTVAILPFADLSPQADKAYFAEGVAEAILSTLASEPNIRVIGRSSTRQFHDNSTDIRSIGKALGVTHVLEGSARTDGDQLRMSVRLIDAANGSQLWAEDYNRQMSSVFAIQDEIGRAVANRLRGTLAAKGPVAERSVTGIDGYTLYLAARAKMRKRDEKSLREAMELARRVIALDPNYAPGHAVYAELIQLLANNPFYAPRNADYFFRGKDPRAYAYKLAQAHALRAIRLAPDSPEGYAALGIFAKRPQDAVRPLERAISLDPSRTELRLWLGTAYGKLGRKAEASEQIRAAAEMDPLWHLTVRRLAALHASADRHAEAEAVVEQYLKRGGDRARGAEIRAQLARMRGDLADAALQTQLAYRLNPDPEYATNLLILYQPHMLNLPDRAAKLVVVKGSEMFSRLVLSGKNQAELAQVRAEGADIWTKPWEGLYIFALAAARDWVHLEKLYDARPDLMSRLCADANAFTVPVSMIVALKARGRSNEAATLLRCFEQRLEREGSGPWSAVNTEGYLSLAKAQLLAIRGKRAAALGELNRAVDKGWRGISTSPHFADFPALDSLRSSPEYSRAQARLLQIIAAHRDEFLRKESETKQ